MPVLRAVFLLRLSVVCALLLSACSGLPSVLGQPRFQGDTLVGADTWSFTTITLRPSLPQALRAREVMDVLAGPLADAGADLERLPTPSGRVVDFEQDILPYLDGEVVVGFSGSVDTPQQVVLVHTSDVERIMRLLGDTAQPRLTRDARGVVRFEPGSGSQSYAGYKNWLIYSDSAALRDQTLDRIDGKGGPSLATDARYRAVVDRLQGDRIGYGYIDSSPLIARVTQQDPRFADALEASARMAYAFGFEPGPAPGVHVLGLNVEYTPDNPSAIPIPNDGDTLQAMDRLPRASMVALAGPDLASYAEYLAVLSDDAGLPAELDLLLSQFGGPWAVGVTMPTLQRGALDDDSFESAISTLLGGLFFIAQLAPGADTQLIAELVDAVAAEAAGDDEDATSWQHEVVLDNQWLAINAVPATTSLNDLPEDLLASNATYQWVRSGFLSNGTNVYVNLDALMTALLGQLASSEELDALKPFQALGMSSQIDPNGDGRAHMTVLIVSE